MSTIQTVKLPENMSNSRIRTVPAFHTYVGKDVGWLLRSQARLRGGKPFLVWEPFEGAPRTWTCADFLEACEAFGSGLLRLGLKRGDEGRDALTRAIQRACTEQLADFKRPGKSSTSTSSPVPPWTRWPRKTRASAWRVPEKPPRTAPGTLAWK